MKVALVHDWLIHMRGGERVLEAMAEIFPEATIYTLFCNPSRLSPSLQLMKVRTSFLNYLPGIRRYYRWLLPILPLVIKTIQIDSDVDLVISSSHCVAKAVPIPPRARHICYCHTPMRYLWGFEDVYFRSYPSIVRTVIHKILSVLRKWDVDSNKDVHQFVANSDNVRMRIKKYYDRDAHVICPPLDADYFHATAEAMDYYLVVSAFVPYKRVDLVIKAFNQMDRRLIVVGAGPLASAYRKLRKSDNIYFLGDVPRSELRELYSRARALIFPADEDFGIVPLEAQACGAPVLALKRGGSLESVKTGLFFDDQTVEAIQKTVLEFEKQSFDRGEIARQVASFDKRHFQEKLKDYVECVMKETA